jgi:hypothetical protein
MAEPAQFEEKEYEEPLNLELLVDPRNAFWPPGQVLEKHFGFDATLFSSHPILWPLLGNAAPLPGVPLNRVNWDAVWKSLGRPPHAFF